MVKLLTRLIIVSLSLVTALTGCESVQMAQKSNDNGNPSTNSNQSPNTTAILSSMNLNTQVFKNQGDLAFVWQGLLYILDGKTGEVKQLTNSGYAQHPAWSHDGEWIAYISTNSPTNNSGQIWIVRRDGQNAHQVEGQSFSWSPTSDVLAASDTDGLWLVPVEGEAKLEIKGSVSYPSWSPDGKSIAYSVTLPFDKNNPEKRNDALYTLTLSSGNTVMQTTASNAGIQIARWWPNGDGLLYWSDPLHSASLAADGLGLMSLRLGDKEAKLLTTGLTYRSWLSVSPQGQLLAVTGGGRIVWAQKTLSIINVEAGTTRELPNPEGDVAIDPSLSKDGKNIAFVSAKNLGNSVWGFSKPEELANWIASRTLWIENVDGSGAHPLKVVGTGVYQPVWSKDGTRIMYVRDNSLWIIGANGENPEKILGPFPGWEKDQFGFYGDICHDDFAWFQP